MNSNTRLENRKKYVVNSLDAAKLEIHRDFGESGMIESIEEIPHGGIMGFLGRRRYVVIAGIPARAAIQESSPAATKKSVQDGKAFLENLLKNNHSLSHNSQPAGNKWEISATPGSVDSDKLKEIISGLRTAALKKNHPQAARAYGSAPASVRSRGYAQGEAAVTHTGDSFASTLAREQEVALEKLRASKARPQESRVEDSNPASVRNTPGVDLKEEMFQMRNAIQDLSNKFHLMSVGGKAEQTAKEETVSEKNLRELREKLLEHDFETSLVDTYVADLKKNVELAVLEDDKTLQSVLGERLKRTLKIRDSVFRDLEKRKEGESPRIMVFVGPTGVGKTTTIAKLTDTLITKGNKVALLTVDTFKVGGLEQLKHYSLLLDADLDVVFEPEDIESALAKHSDKDVILVDTMGRSQRDVAFTNLKAFLNGGLQRYKVETHLCLAANTRYRDMVETIKAFNHLNLDCLLFTKLDETCSFGSMLSVLQRSAKEISYITYGQVVPGNYRVIDQDYLADLMFRTSI